MGPELRIILFLIAAFGFAYVAVYPRLGVQRLGALLAYDAVISAVVFLCIAVAYAGQGLSFVMLGLPLPWWAFTVLAGVVIEIPFYFWFCSRHGIDPWGRDIDD